MQVSVMGLYQMSSYHFRKLCRHIIPLITEPKNESVIRIRAENKEFILTVSLLNLANKVYDRRPDSINVVKTALPRKLSH